MTTCIAAIHAAEQDVGNPLVTLDKTAYALYGSCEPTPRTWFNQIVARWLIAEVNDEVEQIFGAAVITCPGAGCITISLLDYQTETVVGYMYCGRSKTSFFTRVAATAVGYRLTAAFTGLTKGLEYYFQFRPNKVTDDKYVAKSGIYHHRADI